MLLSAIWQGRKRAVVVVEFDCRVCLGRLYSQTSVGTKQQLRLRYGIVRRQEHSSLDDLRPREEAAEYSISFQFKRRIPCPDAQNLDLVEGDVVGRNRVHECDQDRVICPDAAIDEDPPTFYMLMALQICRCSRSRSCHPPHWSQVVVPKVLVMVGLKNCDLGLRHHEGWDDKPGCRFSKKMIAKACLQGVLKRFMIQPCSSDGAPQTPPLAWSPGWQWRKNGASIISVEADDICRRDTEAQAKGDDSTGRGSCDHVEVVCKRSPVTECFLAMAEDFGRIDAADTTSIKRQNLERSVRRPGLTITSGPAAILYDRIDFIHERMIAFEMFKLRQMQEKKGNSN